ncbi:glutamate-1-semialdehyde 2,1-aminomutase [Phaeodactylibacter luteus]|uniref:Glutamate-1-semialdehyde 2,1-aminomutase n=1 Tax=Phaeodactylibacter luteus TaxID=1564516 RepID=A0A5C6RJZ3_9BACT|nr:glutamate-1-semialdehyde 2,1-aminomutase [Phaeodactylibacter luteus]TXB62746.1 glutamate-1-semialdehyde-2,1-aminomutase [Phaeodactylibacter luteus]
MEKNEIILKRQRSAELFEEAKQYFPGGVNSPVRAFKSVFGPPLFIKEGNGCRITDEDDNTYIDFCGSWGPLILGHNNEAVREKIVSTVARGTSFGTPTRLGNELGKLIVDHNRFIDKIRFVSSGTEAVMSAIRLARGITGKSKVVKFEGCYHGHVDSLLVKAGSGLATFGESTSAGIPESFVKETLVLPLNDRKALDDTLRAYAGEIACVIVEPVPANNGLLLQDASFLECLRLKCYKYGVLLIFDEVISGFRVGFEGAAGYYGIQPDIITYGKIIGGGMPVGAYGGSHEVMSHISPDGPVYQAGTLSANPVAMAAGYATLQQLLAPGFYEGQEARTRRLVDRIQHYADRQGYDMHLEQIGSIFWIAFTRQRITRADQIDPAGMEYFKKLHRELLLRGVYLGPSGYEVGFVSAAHTEADLDQAAAIMEEALDVVFAQG